ncbi:MAG: phosphatidate cytidylyltransferase [Coriobacteriia bacterium]|nr:phosphatidate cytidylyltransferase [Coriobacteriia bacterium]
MTDSDKQAGTGLSTFVTRVGTAVGVGLVFLVAILWGRELGLALVVSFVAVMAVVEFYAIARNEERLPNEVFGVLAAGSMPVAAAYFGQLGLLAVVTGLIVASLVWHVAFRQVRTSDTAVTVFGAVYVGFMLSHFVLIRALDSGSLLALATILSVWVNDVFAYLVGSTVGRHRMAPRVSPRKSWEGFAAGTACTILVWIGAFYVIDTDLTLGWFALIGVAVSVAGVVGDLAESRLKREVGIKDSGNLLPGHGGFLDRFDSLIMVSVVAYYMLVFGGAI